MNIFVHKAFPKSGELPYDVFKKLNHRIKRLGCFKVL